MDEGSEIAKFFRSGSSFVSVVLMFFYFLHHPVLFPSLRSSSFYLFFIVNSISWVPSLDPFHLSSGHNLFTTKTAIRKDIVFSGTPRFRGRSRGSSLA